MAISPLELAVNGICTNVPAPSVVSENLPSATNPSLNPRLSPILSTASAPSSYCPSKINPTTLLPPIGSVPLSSFIAY